MIKGICNGNIRRKTEKAEEICEAIMTEPFSKISASHQNIAPNFREYDST